jgi:hypothetical protein
MKEMLKLLWVVVAIALVAPTTTLDLQTLFDNTGDVDGHRPHDLADSQQTTPVPPLRYTLCPGDTTTLQYKVHIPPAPLQADIIFAFDTTLSMDRVIETAQQRAVEIMSNLQALLSDVQFGIVDFRDYPISPFGGPNDWPYQLRQTLTHNTFDIQARIEELESEGGGDVEEAYSRVLYEAYADEHIDWRPEARHFVIAFGDSVPHDDDLNAGVPMPQPFRPGLVWQTGGYLPPHLDPGRDGRNGTDDDLDFQPVLDNLGDHSITLLFIVSGVSHYLEVEGLTVDDLLTYWQAWAGMTGPGGDAKVLEDANTLPATIQSLVTAAVRHLNQLTVLVAPSWFDEWVTIVPPTYEDFDIPPDGLDRHFEVTITVPLTVPADHYMFDLIVEGDGTVYQRQRVEITVPEGCFATPTPTWEPPPTPRPRWMLYVPFVANDLVNW